MAKRRRLEDRMRRVLHAFNYREVQTPTFEELELFTAKSGPGIRDELYAFKDKSGRDLALRPELTAPVMRFYFHDLKTEAKPLRLFYFGPCFRYDRPQAGRYREFWQLGVELVGDASAEAHAELLWLVLRVFQAAGLNDLELRVGHLAILRNRLDRLGFPQPDQGPLMRLIDKKDLEGLRKALEAKAPNAAVQEFLRLFETSRVDQLRLEPDAGTARRARDHIEAVLNHLGAFGADLARVRFDPTIARGLDYYTGLVFELDCPALGAQKQLLGGGEYDLSSVFEAPPVACTGFALGFDRTLVALEETAHALPAGERVDAYVASLAVTGTAPAQRVANALRDLDLRVELDLSARGAKKVLQRAAQLRARTAVLVGEREVERGVAAIKNLDTGEQLEAPLAEVGQRITPWLAAP